MDSEKFGGGDRESVICLPELGRNRLETMRSLPPLVYPPGRVRTGVESLGRGRRQVRGGCDW